MAGTRTLEAREEGRARVHRAARAHEPEERRRGHLHDEAEAEADHDAQHERLPRERRRVSPPPGTQSPRHRRGRPRPDAAGHRRDGEERDREDERYGTDRLHPEPAHEVGVDDVRDGRDGHDERRGRGQPDDGGERPHREQAIGLGDARGVHR